ncbi:MAG: transposase [Chloroflexi bacterium]|nr:transposase [Chloroflexota bacterium]
MLQQTLAECIEGLEMAWRFFGGVPQRLILDNFPAAVAGADALEPRPTRGFLEYSQERGFFIDAARVRKPRDKPHVERGIQYVRERFSKGGTFRDLDDCREQAERWCRDVAGLRVHGTTRQLPRAAFEVEERASLQPYDGVIYDVPVWKEVTVHPDHHVSYGQALYSVTSTTCPPGTKLEVRGDRGLVKLYRRGELVKVHPRQHRGGRSTDADDYPAEKTAYALRAPDRVVRKAAELGSSVEAFAQKLFEGPLPWAKLRAGQKLVSLGERYGGERLDAACKRALAYDLVDVRRVHRILLQALGPATPAEAGAATPLGSRFARPGSAFDHHQPALQEATA